MKNTILECETLDEVKELFNHKDWFVRLEAYRALGFTQDALNDESSAIILAAKRYFHGQKLKEKDEEFRIETENELLQEMASILNRNSQLLEIYSINERPKSNVYFSLLRQYSNEHDYAYLNDLGVVTVTTSIQTEVKMSWEHLVEYEGYVGWFYQSDFTELTKQLSGE